MQNMRNEKLWIEYEKADLLDFFESSPLYFGEEATEEQLFTLKQNCFEIICFISGYEFIVSISLVYIDPSFPNVDATIFEDKLTNVLKIEKENDNTLKIICENEKSVLLKKSEELGVFYEYGLNDTIISY